MQHNKQNLLQTQWTGPYVVLEKSSLNNYKVQIEQRVKIYHANMLKKFIERETEKGDLQVASFINPKIMRWPMILQQYRFVIRAIK